tara:strand:+ start:1729 stop:1881 length:153 start_codon:yes stop_codon:yes gene_type:complete
VKTKTLEFDLSQSAESDAFGNVCKSLNQNGIPYSVSNSGCLAIITIGDGY